METNDQVCSVHSLCVSVDFVTISFYFLLTCAYQLELTAI